MKITNEDNNYKILKDDGTSVVLTSAEAWALMTFIRKENLRDLIGYEVDDAEEDWLDLSKYDGTRDEFIDEIFSNLEYMIDNGDSVSTEYVYDQIDDLGRFYKLEKEE